MDGFEDDASPPDNGTPFDSGIGRLPSMPQQQVPSNSTPRADAIDFTVVQDFPISFLTHFSSPPRAMIS
jgi:hypothetical protein